MYKCFNVQSPSVPNNLVINITTLIRNKNQYPIVEDFKATVLDLFTAHISHQCVYITDGAEVGVSLTRSSRQLCQCVHPNSGGCWWICCSSVNSSSAWLGELIFYHLACYTNLVSVGILHTQVRVLQE